MAPQSNPDSLPAGAEEASLETPSADDLLALVPDMELLETSAEDALAAHVAMAASASGRKSTAAPVLIKTNTAAAATARLPAPNLVINDDPYAALMPELEAYAETAPVARAVPLARPVAPAIPPPVKAPMAAPGPAPTARKPAAPAATVTPAPVPRPAAAPAPPAASVIPVAAAARPVAPVKASPRPAAAAAPAPAAAAAAAKQPPAADSVAIPPVMDREYIVRNRIVELYLAGRLPVRGAATFERFCQQNPQILDEIGLPERVHAGLRLLDASGKPEPWQEKPKRIWERPYVSAVLAVAVVALGTGTLALKKQVSDQTHKVEKLTKLVAEQPLDAAATTTTIELQPTHAGPAAALAPVVGGAAAQLVNIKLDETHSEFRTFRVTIDRLDQGRVAVLNNLIKDSNNQLGFSLNTSALGAGVYQLTIEGLDWRGDPQPDSWAAITIRH